MSSFSLVVFDLDGTLVDSRKDLADTANALLAAHGGPALSDDRIASMVGEGAPVLIRRAFDAAGLGPPPAGALEAFLALYDERLLVHTRAYPGIPGLLAVLAEDHTLAVLTNKPARPARAILDELALSRCFRAIVGGDGPLGKKPDPSGLLQLVHEAAATPRTTLMVGDSAIDLETARRAGTRVCLARYGFGFRFRPEDLQGDELVIDKPEDLLALIRAPA